MPRRPEQEIAEHESRMLQMEVNIEKMRREIRDEIASSTYRRRSPSQLLSRQE
jgi:hypothetical protein